MSYRPFRKSVVLAKVKDGTHTTYGIVTSEVEDSDGEICDYASPPPYYQERADSQLVATTNAGIRASMGNVGWWQHSLEIAGKVRAIDFANDKKEISPKKQPILEKWPFVRDGFVSGLSQAATYMRRCCANCGTDIERGKGCPRGLKTVPMKFCARTDRERRHRRIALAEHANDLDEGLKDDLDSPEHLRTKAAELRAAVQQWLHDKFSDTGISTTEPAAGHTPMRGNWEICDRDLWAMNLLDVLFGKPEEMNGAGRCPTTLYRWHVLKTRWFDVYIHKFVRDEWALDLHDHPNRFVSIGLKGSFLDWTPFQNDGELRLGYCLPTLYRAPWIRFFPPEHKRRITVPYGPCWTRVMTFKATSQWGWWHDGYFMHSTHTSRAEMPTHVRSANTKAPFPC